MEWYWLQWISGAIGVQANQVYDFNFVSNKDEVYFIYHTIKNSVITRAVVNQTLYSYERYIWIEVDKKWIPYMIQPQDKCDRYNLCGAYGSVSLLSRQSASV